MLPGVIGSDLRNNSHGTPPAASSRRRRVARPGKGGELAYERISRTC